MKRVILFFFILLVTVGLFAQNSEKRVALIIGNSNYRFGGALTYPNQDVQTMKNALQELNFDVIFLSDATQLQMRDAFLRFMRKVDISNISLIYYSGHGIQIDGVNYLVPIDANISDKYSAKAMSINVNDWVSQLEVNEKNLNIVILDACRNNPFKAFTKSTENGLKPIPAPSGTIIAFATIADNVAQDNGLYSKILATEMLKPQRIEDVFINTRNIVEKETKGQQSPMEWVRIKNKFYFKEPKIPNWDVEFGKEMKVETFGRIELTSEITGDLYINGIKRNSISSGNMLPISKINTGTYFIEIRGMTNWSETVTVNKDQTVYLTAKTVAIPSSEVVNNMDFTNNSGIFFDYRDGNKYKWIRIGEQVWFAENIRYSINNGCWAYVNFNDHSKFNDWKTESPKENLKIFGYLYNWETATKVCPSGWHLPSEQEFMILLNHVGGKDYQIKSKKAYDALIRNGSSGFESLFGGWYYSAGTFNDINIYARYWSSTQNQNKMNEAMYLSVSRGSAYIFSFEKPDGFSVRCIKDK